jgi:hypothetical protein
MTPAQLRALIAAINYAGDVVAAAIYNIDAEKEGRESVAADIEVCIERADTFIFETGLNTDTDDPPNV